MNKVYDNNGNELVIGMNEWNYVQKMIDIESFYCSVSLEGWIIKKENVNGEIALSVTDENGQRVSACLTDNELPGWNPFGVGLDDVHLLMDNDFRLALIK